MKKILIFTLTRSGGSYVSQILSKGDPILTEPVLPDDGFISTLTDNVKRLNKFQTNADNYQVIKVINFKDYLDMLKDRSLDIPSTHTPVVLFRHPYTQIASVLFTFHEWDDNWAPRHFFQDAIDDYKQHVKLANRIKKKYPKTIFVKYEDTIGDGMLPFLDSIYPANSNLFYDYAISVQGLNYKLGPTPDGDAWDPSLKKLTKKEKFWVLEKLSDEIDGLGYGR